MKRSLLTLFVATLLAGCGGASSHSFFVDGEQVGGGECQDNTCHFDYTLGKPTLTGWTQDGQADGAILLAAADAEKLLRAGVAHQLEVDGRIVTDVYLTPDGTAWRAGQLAGFVELSSDGSSRARLVSEAGQTLHTTTKGDVVTLRD